MRAITLANPESQDRPLFRRIRLVNREIMDVVEETICVSKPDDGRSTASDIGVLFVHGVGNHREAETLLGFGGPLLSWLKSRLENNPQGQFHGFAVTEARLTATRNEAESPAFVSCQLAEERWVLCESWWGGNVIPPATLGLLAWLLVRGPLLVYFHFLSIPDGSLSASSRQFNRQAIATCIALAIQLISLVAIVLWIIPLGPWRRYLASIVRALTVTLGDSYVLLENDIQRATMETKVLATLDWLSHRCRSIVVVAHSQGAAIAHAAIKKSGCDRVKGLITFGSGLEKLEFLRVARENGWGMVSACLPGPAILGAIAVLIYPFIGHSLVLGSSLVVGSVLLSFGWATISLIEHHLNEYAFTTKHSKSRIELKIPWTDIFASHDLVPMGPRSLLTASSFVERIEIVNEYSYLNDHTRYSDNYCEFIPLLWRTIARHTKSAIASDVILADIGDLRAWHRRQAKWMAAVPWTLTLFGVLLAILFVSDLTTAGEAAAHAILHFQNVLVNLIPLRPG